MFYTKKAEHRTIIYLDESWYNTQGIPIGWCDKSKKGHTDASSNKGVRITIVYAELEDGYPIDCLGYYYN